MTAIKSCMRKRLIPKGFQIKWTLNLGTKNKIQTKNIEHILEENFSENLQAESLNVCVDDHNKQPLRKVVSQICIGILM